MKRAIIYYSLSDNTKEAAEYLANKLNIDVFRIELVKPMPKDFKKQILVGGMQSSFGMTPKISGVPENIGDYEDIIIGTPIWAGKVASPINTLLKKYNVADKVTSVFTFSGGGDNDKCILDLAGRLKNMKANVALADRSNQLAEGNVEKLDKFLEEISNG